MDSTENDNNTSSELHEELINSDEVKSNIHGDFDDKFVSQKDYTPTPYRKTLWEGFESYDLNASFLGLTLDIVSSDNFKLDPMFEVFEEKLKTSTFSQINIETSHENEQESLIIPEEMIDQIKNEAYQSGYENAKSELEEEYLNKLSILKNDSDEKIKELKYSMSKSFEDYTDKVEKNVLNLALNISKKILETTVQLKPDYVFEVIKKALYSIPGAKSATIKLSPEDYEFVKIEGVPDEISNLPIEIKYQSDESVVSGCVIESEFGLMNLEIDQMWDEIRNNLFSVTRD